MAGSFAPVRRIYNRVIFDELVSKGIEAPFDYRSELDVTWVPHPNWYWIWSKATIPYLDHPAVPRAWLLSTLDRWPEDLERYVLKPLYSFAGRGVIVDVDRAAVDRIPETARHEWMLMEKVDYAPALDPEWAWGESRAPRPLPPAGRRAEAHPGHEPLPALPGGKCTASTTTRTSTGWGLRSRCGLASELHSSHAAVRAVMLATPVALEDCGCGAQGGAGGDDIVHEDDARSPREHGARGRPERLGHVGRPLLTAEIGLGAGGAPADERGHDAAIGDLRGEGRGEEQALVVSALSLAPRVERNRDEDRAPELGAEARAGHGGEETRHVAPPAILERVHELRAGPGWRKSERAGTSSLPMPGRRTRNEGRLATCTERLLVHVDEHHSTSGRRCAA